MRFKGVEFILLMISAIFLFSCKPAAHTNEGKPAKYIKNKTKQFEAVNAERFITTDGNKINIQKGIGDSLYKGIFDLGKDSVSLYSKVLKGDLLYFTKCENVGFGNRAYLYVYDTLNKVFINDPQFKRTFLYSSGGKFYIDKELIFCLNKPSWDEKQHFLRSTAAVYEILDKKFHLLKVFSEPEEKIFTNKDIELYKKRINKVQSSNTD